jgi:hypothetical protein
MRDRASGQGPPARPDLAPHLPRVCEGLPSREDSPQGHVVRAPILRLELVLRTCSINISEHHYARASRRKSQQDAVLAALRPLGVPHPPLDVHLTRIASKRLDSDNLAGAFKSIRDAIAKWLRVDDARDDLVSYCYHQELRAGGHWQMTFTRGGAMRKLAEGLVRIEILRREES